MKSRGKKDFTLILFGGLGNQLFQYAAAIFASKKDSLYVDQSLGKPRGSFAADLFDFSLSETVHENPKQKVSRSVSLLFLLLLKVSSKGNSPLVMRFFFRLIQSHLIGLFFRKYFNQRIFLNDGLGYDPKLSHLEDGRALIGCFHTYIWVDDKDTRDVLSNLKLRNKPAWISELEILARSENPTILHIRRGDYVGIPELGFLQKNYYLRALAQLRKSEMFSRVWILTDDPDYVQKEFVGTELEGARFILGNQKSASENLEVMRLGSSYILSNSTFSWWGAFLSYHPSPLVFCPSNWFLTRENPKKMLPENWRQVRSLE